MVVKVKAWFGYDDSLDAFGVHGAGGTLGAMLTGFFANSAINPIFGAGKATGLFEGNWHQLLNQLVGVAIAWTLSIVGTLIILFIVDKTIGLRVSEEDEAMGWIFRSTGKRGTSGRIDVYDAKTCGGAQLGSDGIVGGGCKLAGVLC